MSRSWSDRLVTTVATILGVIAVLAVVTAGRMAAMSQASWAELIEQNEATNALLGVTFGVLGAVAVANRPRNGLSWLFVAEGQVNALAVLCGRWMGYAGSAQPDAVVTTVAAVLAANVWIPGFVLAVSVLPFLFPTGHWLSPAWRWPGIAAVTLSVLATVLAFTSAVPLQQSYPGRTNPLAVFPWSYSFGPFLAVVILSVTFALVGLVCLVLRFRRGDRVVRAQVGWLFLALIFTIAVTPLPTEIPGFVGAVLVTVALSLAVVRYRMYDIDRFFTRSAVYLILTSGVIAIFAAFAWVLGSQLDRGVLGWVLPGVIVALAIGPARELLQRGVDRLMYGHDPYDTLSQVGRQLERPQSATTLLSAVTEAVAHSVRLPYIAVTLAGHEEPIVTSGSLHGPSVDIQLIHADHDVGRLTAGVRRGERQLSGRDRALLADLAPLVAAAAHEYAITVELRQSRERLVLAREEERRRLRRELHDGLGPALAGLALGVGAASRATVRNDNSVAVTLLARAQSDAEGLLADVRRISHDLTPAALDELGLVGALEQRAAALTEASDGALLVEVEAGQLPALPTAIEVAAYRIATEALTNTLRHARASHCTVRLTASPDLRLEVRDDGQGIPATPGPGIGVPSMVERAAEVGGRCSVRADPDGGTIVCAELPLVAAP